MINFSVNGIALYFAAIFSKIPTKPWRILASAMLGAAIAVALLLLFAGDFFAAFAFSALYLFMVGCFCAEKIGLLRRIKLVFMFLIFEIVVGGFTELTYNIFDYYLRDFISDVVSEPENRGLLVVSLVILLSVGIFKMLISFFSGRAGTYSVDMMIFLDDKNIETQAFVDTGNLLKDPMDSSAVVLVKQSALKCLIPEIHKFINEPQMCSKELRHRVRIIPIYKDGKIDLLVGFRADRVCVRVGDRYESIKVTVAIDKEGGSYDGCYALMPSSALDNVF